MADIPNVLLPAALAILNASAIDASTYPVVSSDSKFPTSHVSAMLEMAAREIIGIIANSPNHPDVITLATETASLASGTLLTSSNLPKIGPILGAKISYDSGVTYFQAQLVPAGVVRRFISDTGTLSLTVQPKFWGLDAATVYHPGTNLKLVYVPSTALDNASELPARYDSAVLALGLAFLFPFEGNDSGVNAGNYFRGLAESAKALVAKGESVPPVSPFAEAAS